MNLHAIVRRVGLVRVRGVGARPPRARQARPPGDLAPARPHAAVVALPILPAPMMMRSYVLFHSPHRRSRARLIEVVVATNHRLRDAVSSRKADQVYAFEEADNLRRLPFQATPQVRGRLAAVASHTTN